MVRTKQLARRSTGGHPICRRGPQLVCYDRGNEKRHIPTSRNRRHTQLSKSHCQDTASSKIMANFRGDADFPHFVKLPSEIQNMVWEMLAEEPRVVAVNTKTASGLSSSIPPILHVCSESRAVGLKHYTLAFECLPLTSLTFIHWLTNSDHKINALPPKVYFNFERDTLYLRENWNKGVKGAWCCLSQFTTLVNEGDLKRVKRVGLDVNARVCSWHPNCHPPSFARWDALEMLYIGCEDMRLGSDCPIGFSELNSKDYEDFMRRYRMNPCWGNIESLPQGVRAAKDFTIKVPIMVSIKHL